ncbi:sensor histidine kinase [Noviherbaspirillum pedocola]|uniref:histidine kinase n=1 Tax=Noviherbaspirillum pedocola TaxID=2801341 RepID=A0A934W9M9_9BURK|nr:HAMP domain-containing sensor histidine kinase [Noviherbaspirillum pedocola]MBK4739150.1 HAMP domain-containing histidine kinase [Noviherbaspirillum pedocola]
MRLSDFIAINLAAILQEWEDFAKSIHPSGATADTVELRDHAAGILKVIAADLATEQTEQQSVDKSRGQAPRIEGESMAEIHAIARLKAGFNIDQLVAEYRALRASVLRLWQRRTKTTSEHEIRDMIRFNEAIDQALAESVARYARMVQEAQHLFLAILGHDVRTPLSTVTVGARVLMLDETLSSKQMKVASRILSSAERVSVIVSDLLDFAVANSGEGIPVKQTNTDLSTVCGDVVEEMRAVHADRRIVLELSGDLRGRFDAARIAQALSNLVGNAIQHGAAERLVTVTVCGGREEITIAVHNEGEAIPHETQQTLFDPIKRRAMRPTRDHQGRVGNLGLGLYIASEIIKAHTGFIGLVSTAEDGTTFTIHLPRSPQLKHQLPRGEAGL